MDAIETNARRYLATLLYLGRVSDTEKALKTFEGKHALSKEGVEFYESLISAAKETGVEGFEEIHPVTHHFRRAA